MDALSLTFIVVSAIGVAIAIWLNTKPGKKWLASLKVWKEMAFKSLIKNL